MLVKAAEMEFPHKFAACVNQATKGFHRFTPAPLPMKVIVGRDDWGSVKTTILVPRATHLSYQSPQFMRQSRWGLAHKLRALVTHGVIGLCVGRRSSIIQRWFLPENWIKATTNLQEV